MRVKFLAQENNNEQPHLTIEPESYSEQTNIRYYYHKSHHLKLKFKKNMSMPTYKSEQTNIQYYFHKSRRLNTAPLRKGVTLQYILYSDLRPRSR